MTALEKLRAEFEFLRPFVFEAMDLLGGRLEEDLGRRFDSVNAALKLVEDEAEKWK